MTIVARKVLAAAVAFIGFVIIMAMLLGGTMSASNSADIDIIEMRGRPRS